MKERGLRSRVKRDDSRATLRTAKKEAQTWFTSASACTARCRRWQQFRPTAKCSGIDAFDLVQKRSPRSLVTCPPRRRGAFEATYGWGWFADLLADLGLSAHMSHP